jgi:hypothetical protein
VYIERISSVHRVCLVCTECVKVCGVLIDCTSRMYSVFIACKDSVYRVYIECTQSVFTKCT